MWLETELGGWVQLAHVAQLIPVAHDQGAAVQVVLTCGIEQVVDYGFADEAEAADAIRAVLNLARLADQGLWGRTGDVIGFQQALERQRLLAARQAPVPPPPPAPEDAASSFPPGPRPLTPAEIQRADSVLAGAAEHARTINDQATRGDGDPAEAGRILR